MKLSMQEQNLVSIYHSGTRTSTVSQLREALPCIEEHDVGIAHALIDKLERMGDSAFTMLILENAS